jgi:hypothetical protein
MVPLMVR